MNAGRILVIARESVVEARYIMEVEKRGAVLLVARGLMLPANLFGKRSIYAIAEEVKELGLEGRLSSSIKVLPASDIVKLIEERQVWNFS